MLTAADIRQKYVDFFKERQHTHVASSPLVPPDDPTLLFTTAGMVQFKALYSGAVALPYRRAVTVQKCLRAGGKGSDLENVGKTLRHFTFFEMLGNFSFGDYFKREAITWAWEFCTGTKWLGLPIERIWPTVYGKPDGKGGWIVDDEAEAIWREETGVVNAITRLNEKENFWGPAGETGACGPCSEIKFFTGSEEQLRQYQELARSGSPEALAKIAHDIVEEGDLFLEIWNLVFPQFDHQLDGSRPPLKNRGIDTGMGLERTATAVQFVASGGRINSPYETELMQPLIQAVSEISGLPYPMLAGGEEAGAALRQKGLDPAAVRLAMNACADHARALVFTLAEGIVPSNEGRGYVMRRILRRAARFGKKIGISDPFLYRLVDPVIQIMGGLYPELTNHYEFIQKTIRTEEERFTRTLNQGSERLDQMLAELGQGGTLTGEAAYRLFDTYGFPLDLATEAAEERGVAVDVEGFERCLAEGKARARASWKGSAGAARWSALLKDLSQEQKTIFTGYEKLEGPATVLALISGEQRVDRLEEGQAGVAVLDRTPFYAESGGQVGDSGDLTGEDGAVLYRVEDTQKTEEGYYLHFGEAAEPLAVGQTVLARVEPVRRADTMANHSCTHLLQRALKRVVGEHVTQQGSFVGPEGLRFDFTNPEAVGGEKLRQIEAIVNGLVRANLPVTTNEMSLEEARQTGAIAPFGEKYGARVRVVAMGSESKEFCGGTHVDATGRIGLFVVTAESAVASGVRRIEAKTGRGAVEHVAAERKILEELTARLSARPEEIVGRLDSMQSEVKQLRREMDQMKAERARSQMESAVAASREVAGVKLLCQELPGANPAQLAAAWDAARERSPHATVGFFYSVDGDKVAIVVGVTEDIAGKRLKAGDILNAAAKHVEGKGGGKPALARGGGANPTGVPAMVEALPEVLEKLLSS